MNVREFIVVWLSAVKYAYKDNTYRGTVVNANHISERFGQKEISEVTAFDIQGFYNSLMDNGYKPKTIHYIHTTFNALMSYACELGLIALNPCNAVILPKQRSSFEYNVLDADQLIKLLDYCRDNDTLIYLPVLLASCLGLRRGEVLGLQKSDIKGCVISIRRSVIYHNGERYVSSPKTKHSIRHILASQLIIDEINAYSDDGEYICNITQNQLNSRFKHVVNKLNFSIRFHDLRHTYATLLLSCDVPAKIVSERLGHSGIEITLDLYTHVDINMQRQAQDALDYILTKN